MWQCSRGERTTPQATSCAHVKIKSTLIPAAEEIARFEVGKDLAWVLVVEKEVRSLVLSVSFACHLAIFIFRPSSKRCAISAFRSTRSSLDLAL